MPKSWTIGSHPDCDLVVEFPTVSGKHCRLTRDDRDYLLEDLGSTNGTYLNGERVNGVVRVSRGDPVTLGLTTPIPWPPETSPAGPVVFRIGREPDNDLVLNLPMISGHHARIVWEGKPGEATIEDLGSANGTALGSRDRRITRAVLTAADTIYLGSYELPAAQVLARIAPSPVPSPSLGGDAVVIGRAPDCGHVISHPWRLVALLAQAPLAAIVLVLALGTSTPESATPEGRASASRSVAAILFGLGLAAIWFGLSDAVLGKVVDASGLRDGLAPGGAASLGPRLLVAGALCVCQCVLAWAVVSSMAGLKGSGIPTLGLLILASAVGLALGLLFNSLAPRPATSWAILALTMLPLWLLGGRLQPLPRMASWVRTLANALPSRWAFEGLLLLEADRSPTRAPDDEAGPAREGDLAEDFFPADSERMGTRADVMALGSMLVGLSAAAAFIASASRPRE